MAFFFDSVHDDHTGRDDTYRHRFRPDGFEQVVTLIVA